MENLEKNYRGDGEIFEEVTLRSPPIEVMLDSVARDVMPLPVTVRSPRTAVQPVLPKTSTAFCVFKV